MKIVSAIAIALVSLSGLFANRGVYKLAQLDTPQIVEKEEISDFEKAVQIIKKYETLHQPRHWPLVGYGHKVLPGERFSRNKALSESEADKLLRKDLLKNCAVFREWGQDSLLLGVLAYNIGSGATLRSNVAKKLKAGDRNIYESYIAHSRYRGKTHNQIRNRRIEEFETLFIKETIKEPEKTSEKEEQPIINRENRNHTEANSALSFFRRNRGNGNPLTLSNNHFTACILNSKGYYLL